MINELISQTEATYGEKLQTELLELERKISALRENAIIKYPHIPRGGDGFDSGTISVPDARLLYILVRALKPKTIFEIGTWIGTSAMVMAEAVRANHNGGHVYTCDANSYYSLDSSYDDVITTIHAYSDQALQELPDGREIDFVFADGELTFATIKILKRKLANTAVISTHDFLLPAEKGVLNLVRMQLASGCTYSYMLPAENSYEKYNSGVLGLLTKEAETKQTYVRRVWFTLHLLTNLLMRKFLKKIKPEHA